MDWVLEPKFPAYAERVLPWLTADPVRNTIVATQVTLRHEGSIPVTESGEPWLAWLSRDGVAGAAVKFTDRGVVLSALPPGAGTALAAVAEPGWAAVAGFAAEAGEFARAYAARQGATAVLDNTQHLYELDILIPPAGVPGDLLPATEDDVALCTRWYRDFGAETGQPLQSVSDAATRRLISRFSLWTVGGEPVCMIGVSPPVGGATRIGPVWTPVGHRQHGYAAAATAAVCARLRPGRVLLYAEDADPTASRVYVRIGFRRVEQWANWRLEY